MYIYIYIYMFFYAIFARYWIVGFVGHMQAPRLVAWSLPVKICWVLERCQVGTEDPQRVLGEEYLAVQTRPGHES